MDFFLNFILLVFVIWATFQPGNDNVKYLNDMRDRMMMEEGKNYTASHLELIFEDWKGIGLGYLGHQLFIVILIFLFAWQTYQQDSKIFSPPLLISVALMMIGIVRLYREGQAFWFKDRPAVEKIVRKRKREAQKEDPSQNSS